MTLETRGAVRRWSVPAVRILVVPFSFSVFVVAGAVVRRCSLSNDRFLDPLSASIVGANGMRAVFATTALLAFLDGTSTTR